MLATKAAVAQFGPEGGSVINIGSTISRVLYPNMSIYAATKASVDAITVVLSKELGARKIRVNAINPGMIETEGVHAGGFLGGDIQKTVEATTSLRRIGQPDDIAPTAVYLASPDSKYMTGETLFVNGGMS